MTPSASLRSCTEGLSSRFTFISFRQGSEPHFHLPKRLIASSHICNYTQLREAEGGSEAVMGCEV